MRTNFESARRFCSELDYQAQSDVGEGADVASATARIDETAGRPPIVLPRSRLQELRARMTWRIVRKRILMSTQSDQLTP